MCLFSTCESEEKKSGEREEEKKKKKKEERTGGGKMKSAPHGASGRALWNVASEGRMKVLVTSHHTNVHTHTHMHARRERQKRTQIHTQPGSGTAEAHSPAEPRFEKKKVQRE